MGIIAMILDITHVAIRKFVPGIFSNSSKVTFPKNKTYNPKTIRIPTKEKSKIALSS
jgi:hypothetical protein